MSDHSEPPFWGEESKLAFTRAAIVRRWMAHDPYRRSIYRRCSRFPRAVHLEWLADGTIVDGRISHAVSVQLEDFARQQAAMVGADWPSQPTRDAIGEPWVKQYKAAVRRAAERFCWPKTWGPRAVHYCVKNAGLLRAWEAKQSKDPPPDTYPLDLWTGWRFEPPVSVAVFPEMSWTRVLGEITRQARAHWNEYFKPQLTEDLRQREALATHADWLFQYLVNGQPYNSIALHCGYSRDGVSSAIQRLMAELEITNPRRRAGRPRKA